jgi:hypothetical protein
MDVVFPQLVVEGDVKRSGDAALGMWHGVDFYLRVHPWNRTFYLEMRTGDVAARERLKTLIANALKPL